MCHRRPPEELISTAGIRVTVQGRDDVFSDEIRGFLEEHLWTEYPLALGQAFSLCQIVKIRSQLSLY